MKLKFINLLLVTGLLVGSAQVFTSCKDNEADLQSQVTAQYISLAEKLKNDYALKSELQTGLNNLKSELTTAYDNADKALKADLELFATTKDDALKADLEQKIADEIAKLTQTGGAIETIDKALEELKTDYTQKVSEITSQMGQLDDKYNDLLTKLGDYATKDELAQEVAGLNAQLLLVQGLIQNVIDNLPPDLTDQVAALSGRVDNIDQVLITVNGQIVNITEDVRILKEFKEKWEPVLGKLDKIDDIEKTAGNALATATDALAKAIVNENNIAAHQTAIETLQTNITELNNKLDGLQGQVDTLNGELGTLKDDLKNTQNDVNALQGDVDAIKGQIADINGEIAGVKDDIAGVKESIVSLKSVVDGLEENLTALEAKHDKDVAALREEAQEYFNQAIGYTIYMVSGLRGYVDEQLLVVNERINQNAENIAANTDAIVELNKKIDDVKDEINDVKKSIAEVITRVEALENRISSITIEGCDNDILGYFATPVGVTSNILMSFCGVNEGATLDFPYTETVAEYNNPENPVLTDADLSLVQNNCGLKSTTVASGARLLYNVDGNLGTIYFSVNPVNIDLTGKTFALVNTRGQKSPVVLKNVRPCNQVKTMGYSRTATSASGYYMADATLAPNASVEGVQVDINDGLKDAVRNIVNTKKITKGNLVQVAKGVYGQLNGILPALAVNASWNENGKLQQSNSTYGVAAAIFQPLSYTTMYGKSFGPIHLPTTSFFDQFRFTFDTNSINIDLSDIKFDVDFDGIDLGINLKLSCQINDLGSLTVKAVVHDVPDGGVVDADGNVTFTKFKDIEVVTDASLAGLQDQLNAQLKKEFDNMNAEINNKINAAFDKAIQEIRSRITTGVNDMLDQVQAKIDQTLTDVVEDLQNQVNDHIEAGIKKLTDNRVYDAVEKGIEKINDVIGDPNHYMQPTLLYGASGNYGIISTVADMPTVLQLAGGNAATIVATTYNAEIVTPAYLKYVAVTNVWKYNDKNASAYNGNAQALKLLKAANAQKYMNQPVMGQRSTFPLSLANGSGYVYEIVYQALDFHGRTSTNKYYVRVK